MCVCVCVCVCVCLCVFVSDCNHTNHATGDSKLHAGAVQHRLVPLLVFVGGPHRGREEGGGGGWSNRKVPQQGDARKNAQVCGPM